MGEHTRLIGQVMRGSAKRVSFWGFPFLIRMKAVCGIKIETKNGVWIEKETVEGLKKMQKFRKNIKIFKNTEIRGKKLKKPKLLQKMR